MTPLEKIIRPIVEGQVRGFAKEHPAIVEAVDWYNTIDRTGKRIKSKQDTFVDSLSKRIVRDLTCGSSAARLAAALLALQPGEPPTDASGKRGTGSTAGPVGMKA